MKRVYLYWLAFIACFAALSHYIANDVERIKLALYEDTRVDTYTSEGKYSCPIKHGSIELTDCFPLDATIECDVSHSGEQSNCKWIRTSQPEAAIGNK